LAREIAAFAPDLVHVHDAALWTRWWAPLQRRFSRTPAFITFHGWEGRCPPAVKCIRERQKAAGTAVGSMAVGGFIEKWYGTKADVVIYGATDAGALRKNANDLAPLDRVLFLGRLARDTGAATLLEAWLRFASKNATARLTVIGDGPLRESLLRRVKETAPAETVRWLGAVAPEKVSPLLEAHGLVFAGGYLAILDALAAGARVGALYDNPLRRDYLECFPHADRFLRIAGDGREAEAVLGEEISAADGRVQLRRDAVAWAQTQTWAGVADHYETLWRKAK
jgi:glycosyltransferase involved in cell wall biosynthesis